MISCCGKVQTKEWRCLTIRNEHSRGKGIGCLLKGPMHTRKARERGRPCSLAWYFCWGKEDLRIRKVEDKYLEFLVFWVFHTIVKMNTLDKSFQDQLYISRHKNATTCFLCNPCYEIWLTSGNPKQKNC